MKDIFFCENFVFVHFCLDKYNYTDNRAGSPKHFLAFMEQGTSKIVSRDITLEIKAGDVFYIPKGLPYQSYWYSEDKIKFLSFGFNFFPESALNSYFLQKINCSAEQTQLIKSIPTGNACGSNALGAFFRALAEVLPLMEREPVTPQAAIIEKAKKYISANINCSVSDIAKHCLISESALYGIFKRYAKITPNELKQKILCERAVIMLTTTDTPIQHISDKLGFSSTSYFRKVLYRHTGKTPRDIRKESKGI